MEMPPGSGNYTLLDVHGAGAQRSDPKNGDPDDYPFGHGPQGDVIRIFNYVRLVRDTTSLSDASDQTPAPELNLELKAEPNPFNPFTEVVFTAPATGETTLNIYNLGGRHIETLLSRDLAAGEHRVQWDGTGQDGRSVPSGVYLVHLNSRGGNRTGKLLLAR